MAKQWTELGFEIKDLFQPSSILDAAYIKAHTQHNLSLSNSIK